MLRWTWRLAVLALALYAAYNAAVARRHAIRQTLRPRDLYREGER